MSTRTREEETIYRRELRARKAAARAPESPALTLVESMMGVPQGPPVADGSVLDQVRAEITSMGAGAGSMQGLGAVALRLATVLDTPAAVMIWPQTAAQLRSTLLSMRAEAKASVPTVKSKLAAIRGGRAGS